MSYTDEMRQLQAAREAQVEKERARLKAAVSTIDKHNARKALVRAQRFLEAVSEHPAR